jgi:hypothetical protein
MSNIMEYHSDRGAVGWHVTDPATGTVSVSTAVFVGPDRDISGDIMAQPWEVLGVYLWTGPGPRRAAWADHARYFTTARDYALNVLPDRPDARRGAVQRTMSRPNVLALTA